MTRDPHFILVVEEHAKLGASTTWQLRWSGFAVHETDAPSASLGVIQL